MPLPKHIISYLAECTDGYVTLDNCRLTESSIRDEVMPLIENNHSIVRLSIRLNNLSGQPLKAFKGLPLRIESVNLSQNNLDDDDVSTILDVFGNVGRLDLSSNGFTNAAVDKFTSKAKQSEMKLIGNPIVNDKSYKLLVAHLEKNKSNKDSSVSSGEKRKASSSISNLVQHSLLSPESKVNQTDDEATLTINHSAQKLRRLIEKTDPTLLDDLSKNFDPIMEALRQEITGSTPQIVN